MSASYTHFALLADIRRLRLGNVSAKFLLTVVAEYAGLDANGEWSCYPSQAALAHDVEFSERKVRSLLAWFEELGLIVRTSRVRTDGRGRTSDRITLRLAAILALVAADLAAEPAGSSGDDLPAETPRPTGRNATTYRHAVAGEQLVRTASQNNNNTPPNPPQAGGVSRRWTPSLRDQATAARDSVEFRRFWAAYPHKAGGPLKAAESWVKALVLHGADPEVLIAQAGAFAAHVAASGTEMDKVAHPSTWLNQGRWEDELVEPAPRVGPRLDAMGAGQRRSEVVTL